MELNILTGKYAASVIRIQPHRQSDFGGGGSRYRNDRSGPIRGGRGGNGPRSSSGRGRGSRGRGRDRGVANSNSRRYGDTSKEGYEDIGEGNSYLIIEGGKTVNDASVEIAAEDASHNTSKKEIVQEETEEVLSTEESPTVQAGDFNASNCEDVVTTEDKVEQIVVEEQGEDDDKVSRDEESAMEGKNNVTNCVEAEREVPANDDLGKCEKTEEDRPEVTPYSLHTFELRKSLPESNLTGEQTILELPDGSLFLKIKSPIPTDLEKEDDSNESSTTFDIPRWYESLLKGLEIAKRPPKAPKEEVDVKRSFLDLSSRDESHSSKGRRKRGSSKGSEQDVLEKTMNNPFLQVQLSSSNQSRSSQKRRRRKKKNSNTS